MFIDHIGKFLFPRYVIFRCIGRLAFPIFAFMAVEGFYNTGNFGKYLSRLFIWAIISEIPYNILKTGTLVDFARRNVLWTLLFGLIIIHFIDKTRKRHGEGLILFTVLALSAVICFCYGIIIRSDYGYAGLFTMIVFYLFRGNSPAYKLVQFICLFVINTFLLSPSAIIAGAVSIPKQSLALFALIPIWMYRGKKGYYSKFLKYFYYAFYPLHILFLYALYIIFRQA